MTEVTMDPPLGDGSGFYVRDVDLAFLQIDEDEFSRFRARIHPLGCDAGEWSHFVNSLDLAIKNDGVSQVDVRLQGSSAHFFSGPHKNMPFARDDIIAIFLQLRGRTPEKFEIDRIEEKISRIWPEERRPRRRPFDSLYQLRMDRYPSDIDVQVSSDEIVERARNRLASLGASESDLLARNEKYSFVKKEIIAEVCPYLTAWAIRQSDIMPRPVTVAVFGTSGPPKTGRLSSHFRPRDWIVPLGAGSLAEGGL